MMQQSLAHIRKKFNATFWNKTFARSWPLHNFNAVMALQFMNWKVTEYALIHA